MKHLKGKIKKFEGKKRTTFLKVFCQFHLQISLEPHPTTPLEAGRVDALGPKSLKETAFTALLPR